MRDIWVPAVNRLGRFGVWAFAEFRHPFTMADELDRLIAGLGTGAATWSRSSRERRAAAACGEVVKRPAPGGRQAALKTIAAALVGAAAPAFASRSFRECGPDRSVGRGLTLSEIAAAEFARESDDN